MSEAPATEPPSPAPTAPPGSQPPTTPASVASQSGITNRPPEHCILATFALSGGDARASIETLRATIEDELKSQLPDEDAATDKTAPGPETGELGFHDDFDRAHLTITVGFSSSGYDKLGIAQENRPQDLIPIPWDKLGDSPKQINQGDIILQVCSDDLYVAEHVVHRVQHSLVGQMSIVWTQVGTQRYSSRMGRTGRGEGRALNGFLDGTSNLKVRGCPAGDAELVFVDPDAVSRYPPNPTPASSGGYGQPQPPAFPTDLRPVPTCEPDWARHGTYMVARVSTLDLGKWDAVPLGEQEHTIGRFKYSGAFLGLADDPAQLNQPPSFQSDQSNVEVPLTAHARKANPRGPGDEARRIFRRGYPLISGSAAGFDRGLLFIAFGRTISTQFEFIFRAWMRNENFPTPGIGVDPLFSFESEVLSGGYYFVPPLSDPCQPWSWIVPVN